jgi:hypothetical protein
VSENRKNQSCARLTCIFYWENCMLLGILECIRDFSSKNSIPTRGSAYADNQVDALFRYIIAQNGVLSRYEKRRTSPHRAIIPKRYKNSSTFCTLFNV